MGRMIDFERPDGQAAPGYYAQPEKGGESAPGIVVIQEWWGITADVLEIADRYASLGYRALVPDLYRGRKAATGDEATHLSAGLDFKDAANQDVRGALMHLKEKSQNVGVTGYCMGGALTMIVAMHLNEPDAAVVFYGMPPPEAGDPGTIEIPILCHFAERDEFFTPERGHEVEKRFEEAKVPARVYWYDAGHGFCNPNPKGSSGLGNYDGKCAHLAWERTVEFWNGTLRGSS